MSETNMNKHQDDEIDLMQIIKTIWDGKFKILLFVIVFGFVSAASFLLLPPSRFTADTEVRRINSIDQNQYTLFNSLNFNPISAQRLFDLYIEQVESKELLIKVLDENAVFDKTDFDTEQLYQEALEQTASDVEIFKVLIDEEEQSGEVIFNVDYLLIKGEFDDEQEWKSILRDFHTIAENEVRRFIIEQFDTLVASSLQTKEFSIQDIQTQIENATANYFQTIDELELQHQFNLEDIEVAIKNAYGDYDRQTEDRLAFLKEQGAIARKLGVAKNTIEAQTFSTLNSMNMLVDIETNAPFYLRGYDVIEKEIELIESRTQKEPFIENLADLQRQKRAIIQDKTAQRANLNKEYLDGVLELERQIRALEQNRTIARAQNLIQQTPLFNSENFKAVNIEIASTEFNYKFDRRLLTVLFAALGGIIGMFYILISHGLRSMKS